MATGTTEYLVVVVVVYDCCCQIDPWCGLYIPCWHNRKKIVHEIEMKIYEMMKIYINIYNTTVCISHWGKKNVKWIIHEGYIIEKFLWNGKIKWFVIRSGKYIFLYRKKEKQWKEIK